MEADEAGQPNHDVPEHRASNLQQHAHAVKYLTRHRRGCGLNSLHNQNQIGVDVMTAMSVSAYILTLFVVIAGTAALATVALSTI
jgi:hypothetical protein